jgi:hypothetical protein
MAAASSSEEMSITAKTLGCQMFIYCCSGCVLTESELTTLRGLDTMTADPVMLETLTAATINIPLHTFNYMNTLTCINQQVLSCCRMRIWVG